MKPAAAVGTPYASGSEVVLAAVERDGALTACILGASDDATTRQHEAPTLYMLYLASPFHTCTGIHVPVPYCTGTGIYLYGTREVPYQGYRYNVPGTVPVMYLRYRRTTYVHVILLCSHIIIYCTVLEKLSIY